MCGVGRPAHNVVEESDESDTSEMSEYQGADMGQHVNSQTESQSKLVGLLAEFPTPEALVSAAEQVREEGYRRIDAFSPFPVHGLDEAMAIRPTVLPWLALGAGLTGLVAALAGQWWTNTIDYPFVVSGKPLFSLPANIPVTFEVIILFSAFTAFFGMLVLNGLPRLAQPVFRSERFRRATADRFFLMIEAADGRFEVEKTRSFLSAVGAVHVEDLHDDAAPAQLPKWIGWVLGALAVVALLPPLWIARARVITSDQPRWHTFIDMDYQPKFKPQTVSTLFADGRADRLPVAGTVARGQLRDDLGLYRGIDTRGLTPTARRGALRDDERVHQGVDTRGLTPTARQEPQQSSAEPEAVWVEDFPIAITDEAMKRGQQRYNIYCAPCHGLAGEGDGLVARRAQELQQVTWLPPTSLQSEAVRAQPVGQLFHTITNGARKMPAYGPQISVQDRWAIVLYMRALQRTQNADPEDVPAETLKAMKP